MTTLTIREQGAIGMVPVQLQKYLVAKFNTVIKNYDDYDLERGIKNIVIVSFAELGIKDAGDEKVVTFLRETLFKDFRAPKFEHITLEEIKLFISNGIRGEYPTFNGMMNTLNVQNIHFWIKCGMASKDREVALKEFNRTLDAAQKENNVEVPPEYYRTASIAAFDDYKKDGTLPFFPHVIYDYLAEQIGSEYQKGEEKFKTLITDQRKRVELFTQAKNTFKSKNLPEKKRQDPKTLEELFSKQERAFEFLVKRVYLAEFFNQLISTNSPLIIPVHEQEV